MHIYILVYLCVCLYSYANGSAYPRQKELPKQTDRFASSSL